MAHRYAQLDERQGLVLDTVVRLYVASAQPVSSRAVLAASSLEVSSASVRAIMLELSELGYLRQPHTSAGRLPTQRAYRGFVDQLLSQPTSALLDAGDLQLVLPEGEPGDASDLIQRAADLLTQVTGQVGFYAGRPEEESVLERIHFSRVSSGRVIAVLVARSSVAQTRVIEESQSDARALELVSAGLSEIVAGLTLSEARARLASMIEGERVLTDELRRQMVVLGWEGLARSAEVALVLGDRHGLLAHPEFNDVELLRALMETLEHKERMLRLLDKIMGSRVAVAIGAELDQPEFSECAGVAIRVGDGATAQLGVIGPARMPYDRVIPAVRYVSGRIADYLC